jgi:hypothetical protein
MIAFPLQALNQVSMKVYGQKKNLVDVIRKRNVIVKRKKRK